MQAAAVAAVGLLVVSCGRDVSTLEATPEPTDSATTSPATPTATPPMTELPQLPSKTPRDRYAKRTYPITSAHVDQRDIRKVKLEYELPTPCSPGLERAAVVEESGSVIVTLIAEPDPKDKRLCAQVIVKKSTTVTLDEPLADRELVDGATGVTVLD